MPSSNPGLTVSGKAPLLVLDDDQRDNYHLRNAFIGKGIEPSKRAQKSRWAATMSAARAS